MPLTRPKAAQVNFDVTNISDPLLRINSGESGSADKDTGIVIERGSDDNVALIYDESADQFAFINTDEVGTTSGNVTISSYADIKANAFYGDGSNLTGVSGAFTAESDGASLTDTSTGSSAGPVITLTRNPSDNAGSDADYLGQLKFKGDNDAGQSTVFAKITGKILDASDGTEDGILEFAHQKAGSNVITGRWRSDSLQLLNGTTLVVSGLTYPTSDGTSGQALTTDGSGNLSFSDVAAGGTGRTKFTFNVTGSVTTLSGTDANSATLAYTAGQIDVYVNGVRVSAADITATNGTSIVFGETLVSGDVVDIISFTAFDVVTNNASDLSSGTIPDARFPATLPAISGANLTGITSTTINNNADNRVITGSGTANTLEGEANLTFDGSTLASIPAGSSSAPNFAVTSGALGVNGMYVPSANTLAFSNASTERMRIDSSGHALFGTTDQDDTSGGAGIRLKSYGRVGATVDGGISGLFNRLTSDGNIIGLYKDNSAIGSIGTDSGDVYIAGTTHGLKFDSIDASTMYIRPVNNSGSNVTGQIDLGQSGNVFRDAYVSGGVYFAPHSYPANYLDDYEEGTWTATLTGSTTNPSTTVSVAGTYTKIGNMCYAQFQLSNVNSAGASGGARITGLPFTASGSQATGNVMTYVRFTLNTGSTNISPYVSGTQIAFYQSTSNGGWSEITHNAGTGAYISASVFYKTI